MLDDCLVVAWSPLSARLRPEREVRAGARVPAPVPHLVEAAAQTKGWLEMAQIKFIILGLNVKCTCVQPTKLFQKVLRLFSIV